jgi:ABC-2 type transport system ATP-binding protein
MSPDTPPSLPQAAIDVHNLAYAYKKHQAVVDMSFSVATGAIHGFVGPNGAGKTTSLRVIATLLKPQSGSVRVFGHNLKSDPQAVRRKIGFMPDHFSMYRQMTVFEYLDFFAAAYGLNLAARDATIRDVLELTDMHGRRDDLIKGLSRGMQQRVSLARVLVHDPDLLLLDEPASGLDPRARIELMDILRELQRMGKTIFISSHILSELSELCDSVTIVDRGQVRYTGPMRDLLESPAGDSQRYRLVLEVPHPALAAHLRGLPGVDEVEEVGTDAYVIQAKRTEAGGNGLLAAVLAAGAPIKSFQPAQRHLNQAFMDLTEEGVRT